MGRTKNKNTRLSCPAGVEIRHLKSGRTTLRIHFYYKNIRCREQLNIEATAANVKYAERKRIEILNAIERGTFNYAEYFPCSPNAERFCPTSKITIGELLKDYLAQAEKSLRYSTFLGYKRKSDKHLFPTFGELPIRELTPKILRNWIANLNLTIKTVREILTPLRAIIKIAIVDEIIDKNPLDNIVLNDLLNRKTRKSKYKVDPMSLDEIQAILDTAAGQLKNFLQFAFFTGLRTSELIALEWNDIDWTHRQIHITRTIVEGIEEDETKTALSKRTVLLLPPALEALQKQKQHTFLANGKIFHDPLTQAPWEGPGQIRERWRPLLRKAGVRYRNPYQTRHTYASMMLSKGENMLWVARQMGHVNTQMLMKVYGQWIPDANSLGGYQPKHNWSDCLDGPTYVPQQQKFNNVVNFTNKNRILKRKAWRPQGDSNPCCRRERAKS